MKKYTDLETMVYRHSTLAAGLALATLAKYTDDVFYEPLQNPMSSGKSASPKKPSQAPVLKFCKVYPNPSMGIVLVEIPAHLKNVSVEVIDANGKVMFHTPNMQTGSGTITLNLRVLASGSYTLYIEVDEKLSEAHRIQISR